MAVFNVPLSGQNLQNTRVPINDNFNNIDTAFSFDHVPINTGANSGKHNHVTLPNQVAGPATLANEMAIYTKLVAGIPQAFLRQNTSGTEVNLTSFVAGPPGYTYLPSGLILQWGIGTSPANTATHLVPLAIPFTTTVFAAVGTPNALATGNQTDNIFALSPTGGAPYNSLTVTRKAPFGTAVTFYFVALGI